MVRRRTRGSRFFSFLVAKVTLELAGLSNKVYGTFWKIDESLALVYCPYKALIEFQNYQRKLTRKLVE